MSMQEIECETMPISLWSGDKRTSVRLFQNSSIGLCFVLAAIHLQGWAPDVETQWSHAVNQPSCHCEHQNDKIGQTELTARLCKGCGQNKEQSAFASKGQGRPSVLCKDCDNSRRRASYTPKAVTPDWDNVLVTLAPSSMSDQNISNLLLELIDELDVKPGNQQKDSKSIDSIITGGASLDDLIRS